MITNGHGSERMPRTAVLFLWFWVIAVVAGYLWQFRDLIRPLWLLLR